MKTARWMCAVILSTLPCVGAWADSGEGLQINESGRTWSRWQGRFAVGTPLPSWRSEWGGNREGLKPNSFGLMGDYYFSRSFEADGGSSGFRATSGLVVGPRPTLWVSPSGVPGAGGLSVERRALADPGGDSATLPYLGIGYTGLTSRGGWSFSADFGLAALAGGNGLRVGRVLNGSMGLEDLVRDLRLTPVLQIGASYSF